MSKVIEELEPSDIRLSDKDVKGDPMHDAVTMAVIVASLGVVLAKKDSDPDEVARAATASFLNRLDRSGFAVVKKEVV